MEQQPQICDYEGSNYRTEFWTTGREYEDAVERVAMQALLPPSGRRLIEVGAGFGRLADLYAGYEEVVLMDYARSQLVQARELWGDSGPGGRPLYRYVQADFYSLPFAAGLFDTVAMVRVLHHAADAPQVIQGLASILAPRGTLVLEYANKRNIKAILRYLVRGQTWSPFDPEPVEFVRLNFNFHPSWIRQQLTLSGLQAERTRTVSHFRLGLLKRIVPTGLLVAMDRLCQPTGALWQLTPSVFTRSFASSDKPAAPEGSFFRCTVCGSTMLENEGSHLVCLDCDVRFPIQDGIYDFLAGER